MNEPYAPLAADDPLFQRFPLTNTWTSPSGISVPVPFHAYDADALILQGHANFSYFDDLLRNEPYTPVRTDSGHALAFFWAIDYRRTTLGSYHELVLSVAVTHDPKKSGPLVVQCRDDDVYCASRLLALDPRAALYAVKLWLTEQLGVDYGREILGMEKKLLSPALAPPIRQEHDQAVGRTVKRLNFVEEGSEMTLVEANIVEDDSTLTQLLELPDVLKSFGFLNFLKILANSYVRQTVVGRPGIAKHFPHTNPRADTWFRTDPLRFSTKFQKFDSQHTFTLGKHPDIVYTDFQPFLIQRSSSMRLVLLTPYN